eukprot:2897962-Ditylum_brightwellii.AAC.1
MGKRALLRELPKGVFFPKVADNMSKHVTCWDVPVLGAAPQDGYVQSCAQLFPKSDGGWVAAYTILDNRYINTYLYSFES